MPNTTESDHSAAAQDRRAAALSWRGLVGLFVAAVVLRVAVGAWWNVVEDSAGNTYLRGYRFYARMAEHVVDGNGMRMDMYFGLGPRYAGRPPLFPGMVAGILAATGSTVWPVLFVQALLGGMRTLFVALIGARLGGRAAGWWAGAVACCYPYWLANDTTMLENTLFGALVVAGIWCLLRVLDAGPTSRHVRWTLAAGVVFGLATLTREIVGLFLPFAALTILFVPRSRPFARRFVLTSILTATVFTTCLPWLVRNQNTVGSFTLSMASGRGLWIGNNAHTFDFYPETSIDASERVAWYALPKARRLELRALGHDEKAQEAEFREMGAEWIRENRGEFVRRGFVKVWALFAPVIRGAYSGTSVLRTIGYTGGYVVVALLAVLGFAVRRRELRLWMWLTAGAFASISAMAFVYWGQARLRAVYEFFLVVPAALALDWAWRRLRTARGKETAGHWETGT